MDLLIHDAQYSTEEYPPRVGWGHSTFTDAIEFAAAASVKRLVLFHHDPGHSDARLDALIEETRNANHVPFEIISGVEGAVFHLGG